jgi:RNA-directed DNA polymerase
MTAMAIPFSGAPLTPDILWKSIDWQKVVRQVRQLQMRIVKAFRQGKKGKVKALQRILAHSFYAKLLAIRRVTQNQGAKTPGVDNVVWNTPKQKMEAALTLKQHGYQAQPLKRIYIPKKQKGKLRPLSIPTMKCRGMQALHLLTLEPLVEITADKNAYGFRPLRSIADAIAASFNALARKNSAQYILEGDIKSCFDSISSQWLLEKAPMDKKILKKWLTAGYIEKAKLYPTSDGTAQGSIISPSLLTFTLSGLEKVVKLATKPRDKVNIVVYADDFIITAKNQEILEHEIKPVVEAFLGERGLLLSQEKTKITHINEGFDFLGMNIRKYDGKLIIKPAKNSVKQFLTNIRATIKHNATAKTENLIHVLNPRIRGWANQYRHVCSKRTFNYIDHQIFKSIWSWAVRRHPNKGKRWIKEKYFRHQLFQNWIFSANTKNNKGERKQLDLVKAVKTPIRRHIKIKGDASPYDSEYHQYFDTLISKRKEVMKSNKKSNWWLCWWELFKPKKSRAEKTGSSETALSKARAV